MKLYSEATSLTITLPLTLALTRNCRLVDTVTDSIHLYPLCYATNRCSSRPLVVQRFRIGLVIKRSLVRLTAGALSSQLGQLSLPSLWGR